MTYVLAGGVALIGLLLLWNAFQHADLRKLVRSLRWIVGGLAALIAAFLVLRGQVGIGSIVGAGAWSILKFGRLGPLVFGGGPDLSEDNLSEVKSRFFEMTLDHSTGAVEGRVVAGAFVGRDLIDLDEFETRALIDEIEGDPDSVALLESWLDRNRAGWREYFAGDEPGQSQADAGGSVDPDLEDWAVLGLSPGASAEEIRAAHRKLMMAVHPDHGGSDYLAARINQAKDRLLRKAGRA
ncbi:MAG: J domain-containing protein [Devosia sp.]